MNSSNSSQSPKVIAFRALLSGDSFSLLQYNNCLHLALYRQGQLQQFLNLGQRNLRRAFGKEFGDRIWQEIVVLRRARRR